MNNFKVSVIVPVFNASQYIGKTLDSIINQDFDGYEIIVVDDGSTDNSLDIVNEALKSCEIPHQIIHQEKLLLYCLNQLEINTLEPVF